VVDEPPHRADDQLIQFLRYCSGFLFLIYHLKIGPLFNKYLTRRDGVSPEDIRRCYMAIEDEICSVHGCIAAIASVHGGGSPMMEEIAILKQYDLKYRKELAKYYAGIRKDFPPLPKM